MKKYIVITLLVIIVAVVVIVEFSPKNKSGNVVENISTEKIIGYWSEMFPVPAGTNGYWLLGGGIYTYKLDYPAVNNPGYIGSSGIWRHGANGAIEIQKKREFFLREGNVSCNLTDIDWHIIGDSSTYLPYNPDTGSPATLTLVNDKYLEEKSYYLTSSEPSKREQESITARTVMDCL